MRSGATPVPIPNTMVKTWPADGTALETVWESRWPPDLKKKNWSLPVIRDQKKTFDFWWLINFSQDSAYIAPREQVLSVACRHAIQQNNFLLTDASIWHNKLSVVQCTLKTAYKNIINSQIEIFKKRHPRIHYESNGNTIRENEFKKQTWFCQRTSR